MIFSVIVPFFNEALYIQRCLKSLIEQDFDKSEYEIIFIDNGSTDGSADIVRKFPQVILLWESRKSDFIARNKGLEIARGKIIAFTDADCRVSPGWLTEIYKGMNRTAAMIALGKRNFSSNGSWLMPMLADYENTKADYVLSNCQKKYFFGYTNNMAVRSEVFKRLGFFAGWPCGADHEIIHRCIFKMPDSKVVYLDAMEVIHLEVKSLKDWLSKLRVHGKYISFARRAFTSYRPLNYKLKLRIYYICFKRNGYALIRKMTLFFLLLIGNLFNLTGKLTLHKGFSKTKA
ncbi:MAG: glycosyltransferase family 2 protein [Candidatus Omnitrophica bacterium]|nr:glycosyltransferase family 2 protein [Candidatus Omnitrophota bacterium]